MNLSNLVYEYPNLNKHASKFEFETAIHKKKILMCENELL